MKALHLLALTIALSCAAPGPARAGTSCEDKPLSAATFAKAMTLAERSVAALDQSGAEVALIARAGQDLSKYGLRFSHMAYAWRDHPQGRWLVVHELNQCGTASSTLFDEGLGNFFLDDMHTYASRIVVPSPAIQRKLAAMLASSMPLRLHEARYNMLAFPFSTSYQNSNQWLLETWAAAVSEPAVANRGDAQRFLRQRGFSPITVEIDAMTRLGARISRANISFDDQPFERRMAGHIDTVTVDAVVRFVLAEDGQARVIDLAL